MILTITCSYFDHVKYSASEFINRDKDFVGNGVLHPGTDFALTFPGGMTINVGAGTAWVGGRRIGYDADPVQALTLVAANPTYPRIDLIEVGYTGTGASGVGQIKVVTGVSAPSPLQPQPDTGFIGIYAVSVGAGVTSISVGNVQDIRAGISIAGATNTPLASTIPATITPSSTGNAGVGTSAARDDHQHPAPASYPPNSHASSHGTAGSDRVTPAAIGAAAASDLTAYINAGTNNKSTQEVKTLLVKTDTRRIEVTRTSGQISSLAVKDPSDNSTVTSVTVNRTSGQVSSVVATVGTRTITTTVNRTSGQVTSITKAVS